MDKQNDLILCVAGQSNAVGCDESYVSADYLDQLDRTRIRQLGLYGDDNLNVIPLGVCAQSYQTCVPSAIRTTPAPTRVPKRLYQGGRPPYRRRDAEAFVQMNTAVHASITRCVATPF